MTKIPQKPKKLPKYSQNLKNDQKYPKTKKITKIPLKPNNYQNISETYKFTEIAPKS